MFFRSLSRPVRLSTALRTQVCSRSMTSLRSRPSLSHTPLRQFSTALKSPVENPVEPPTSHAPTGTCFIANIPYNVTAEQLKSAFSDFGKVKSIKLLTSDAGSPRGVGFVEFESVEEAVSFVEENRADPVFVLDRQLHVDHAQYSLSKPPISPSDTLVLFDLHGASEAEIRAMFGNYADCIQQVRYSKERDPAERQAFIQFSNVNIAMEAMDTFKSQRGDVQIRYAKHRQSPLKSHSLVSRLSRHQDS